MEDNAWICCECGTTNYDENDEVSCSECGHEKCDCCEDVEEDEVEE